jgi:hypothetical protein
MALPMLWNIGLVRPLVAIKKFYPSANENYFNLNVINSIYRAIKTITLIVF